MALGDNWFKKTPTKVFKEASAAVAAAKARVEKFQGKRDAAIGEADAAAAVLKNAETEGVAAVLDDREPANIEHLDAAKCAAERKVRQLTAAVEQAEAEIPLLVAVQVKAWRVFQDENLDAAAAEQRKAIAALIKTNAEVLRFTDWSRHPDLSVTGITEGIFGAVEHFSSELDPRRRSRGLHTRTR